MEKDDDATAQLGKDAGKRLKKLREEWDKPIGGFGTEKLTVADLRLLLEHSPPVQELIRLIVSGDSLTCSPEHKPPQFDAAQAQDVQTQAPAWQQDLIACQKEQDKLHQQLQDATEKQKKLQAENRRLDKELTAQRQSAQPSALALLRSDQALAERLGLGGLPKDPVDALIRSVAVLSQMGTIERLWDALKETCERERRRASPEEVSLLQSTLEWHNHNWQQRPYALSQPRVGEPFDFNTQLRSSSTSGGEKIAALWLPGIVAGNGDMQKKALVTTQ